MEIEALAVLSGLAAIGATAFVKIFTVLSVFRIGLGLRGPGMSLVFVLLAATLTTYVHAGLFTSVVEKEEVDVRASLGVFMHENTSESSIRSVEKIDESFSEVGVAPQEADPQKALSQKALPAEGQELRFESLRVAFILDELKEGFEISLYILIPFLLIDILVAVVLLFLGVSNSSAQLISLPLKLLGFTVANGWELLAARLLYSYAGG